MPKFSVSRSVFIAAPPEQVYEKLADFGSWDAWSPWLLSDDKAVVTLSDQYTEVGGHYSWDGPVVGAGEMKHEKMVRPDEHGCGGYIDNKLTFTRPWKSVSQTDFRIESGNDSDGSPGTNVEWNMNGSLPVFLFWMKTMMVSMISMDYDRGLMMLKSLIETGAIPSKTEVLGITQLGPRRIVGLSDETTLREIGGSMKNTIGKVMDSLKRAGVDTGGQWISVYDTMDMKNQHVKYTTGMVLPESTPTPTGLGETRLPAVNAMQTTHRGDYRFLGNAWAAAYQNAQSLKRKPSKIPGFEVYENTPEDTEAADLVTQVYLPVK